MSYSGLDIIFSSINQIQTIVYVTCVRKVHRHFYNSVYVRLATFMEGFVTPFVYELVIHDFYINAMKLLIYQIEHTIVSYTNSLFFFLPHLYMFSKPYIVDSKIVCEYLRFYLNNGMTISSAFAKILR